MSEIKSCFVIAPIGEAESDTRKRSDQVLKYIISPAVEICGYKAIRADQISEPGIITSQVIQHIVNDDLVVADLTERNPNVFYELAIRHAIRKPFVQVICKGEQIPFDVAGTRIIYIDHHDLDSVEKAKFEIEQQIKSLEKDVSKLETPISVSLDLQLLRQSDNPEHRSLADILSAISEFRSGFNAIEKKISLFEEKLCHNTEEINMKHRMTIRHEVRQLSVGIKSATLYLIKLTQRKETNNKTYKSEYLEKLKEIEENLATLIGVINIL